MRPLALTVPLATLKSEAEIVPVILIEPLPTLEIVPEGSPVKIPAKVVAPEEPNCKCLLPKLNVPPEPEERSPMVIPFETPDISNVPLVTLTEPVAGRAAAPVKTRLPPEIVVLNVAEPLSMEEVIVPAPLLTNKLEPEIVEVEVKVMPESVWMVPVVSRTRGLEELVIPVI